jgi:hypothetical protein
VPEAVAVAVEVVAVEEVGFPEKVQQVEVGFRPAKDRHKELRETEAPSPRGAAASEARAATSRADKVLRIRTSKLEAATSRADKVLRIRTSKLEAATSRAGRVLRTRTSKLEAVISRIGRVLRFRTNRIGRVLRVRTNRIGRILRARTNRIGRILRARTSRIDRIMRVSRIGTGITVRDMEIPWGSLLLLALPVTLLVQRLNRQQLWRHFHAPRQWCALASKATTNVEKIGTKKCILAVV